MKVICHEDFKESYCSDPAAADGRIEAVIEVIEDRVEFIDAIPADEGDILACHTDNHVAHVRRQGLYDIAALAGGALSRQPSTVLSNPALPLQDHRDTTHRRTAHGACAFSGHGQ